MSGSPGPFAVFPFALLVLFVFGQVLKIGGVEAGVLDDLQRLFPNAEQATLLQVTRLLNRVEVRGGAGSGKTVLALAQARELTRGRADKPAQQMAHRVPGLEPDAEFALPDQVGDDRQDGEEGAEKHQLPGRHALGGLEQARHSQEDADRAQLERNSRHGVLTEHWRLRRHWRDFRRREDGPERSAC